MAVVVAPFEPGAFTAGAGAAAPIQAEPASVTVNLVLDLLPEGALGYVRITLARSVSLSVTGRRSRFGQFSARGDYNPLGATSPACGSTTARWSFMRSPGSTSALRTSV